ncbi:hypothetical protein D4764_13G0012640 [Takifugu flavidus]|uniref:Uncharacterized protein n=1 Tax=Takifugu flavidus TaxID=433684 RepID=A0A5C6PA28_9TELE|nr:hypothetical protein D4764_13G0012640 [Takifugu flavidus]
MKGAVVLSVDKVEQANRLPSTRVTLSNVPPFISDEFLARELARFGKIVSPIRKVLSRCKSPLLKHVVSHSRQVYMILNNRAAELNEGDRAAGPEKGTGRSEQEEAGGYVKLERLVAAAGTELTGAQAVSSALGVRSMQLIQRSLGLWKHRLSMKEKGLLLHGRGEAETDLTDAFPELHLQPDLLDLGGPLLDGCGSGSLHSMDRRILYGNIVKSLWYLRLNV